MGRRPIAGRLYPINRKSALPYRKDDEFGRSDRLRNNYEGLGALQDGETVEIEIQNIGKMTLKVADPLKRKWERGIYMGVDSTNPKAVRRHRPH